VSYKLESLKYDLKGGIAVAAISLPIGVAYSELLGLPPESGIYTAVFALIAYFFLGTSSEVIIGPDSSTVALLASSVFALGVESGKMSSQFIFLTTITAGILFFIAGILRLGFISNFLSRPILVGFLNGVGIVLVIGQLQKFSGVPVADGNSINGLFQFLSNLGSFHAPTLITGLISFTAINVFRIYSPKVPSQLIVIVLSVMAVSFFNFSSYGLTFTPEVSGSFPLPLIPDPHIFGKYFSNIFIDASAILFLSFTNTVLVGKSLSRNKKEYNPDREFYALGVADLVCGIFKGFPASGSSSRTVLNIISGGVTKYSMLLAAVIMVLVVTFFSQQFSMIPAAVFAAIIIDSGLSIVRLKEFIEINEFSKQEFYISLLCLIGVLIIGVLDGILIAIIASFVVLIKKTSRPGEYELVYDSESNHLREINDENKSSIRKDILLYRFNSAMLFFNSDFFIERLNARTSERADVKRIIIDATPVNYIDLTSRNNLIELICEYAGRGIKIVFVNADKIFRDRFLPKLEEKNLDVNIFFDDIRTAMNLV